MYFGVERHKTLQGANIPNTTYSVNNIYLDGVRFAAVIPSGDARYYLTDQVDSPKVVADDDGRAVTRMEYIPYGDTWFEEGDTNNAPKYNSQELDQESNFYYYNARHYSQEISRFVTADTVIDGEFDTQGWNRYAYCKNNPIMYKDPTGHYTMIVELAEDRQKIGKMTFYDDEGKKMGTYKILGKGANKKERTEQNADTPTGIHNIIEKREYTKEKNKERYKTYGPLQLLMEGNYGEAKEANKKRSGISMHASSDDGKRWRENKDPKEEGAFLMNTFGCLRVSKKDAEDIAAKISKIEEKRGHKSGKDPQIEDTVMVFETK